MDRKDELRDEIAGWFFKNVDCEDPHYFPADKARYWADSTLSLLAPELEKARFWDEHVKSLPEIANNIKQLLADAEKWRVLEKKYPMTINNERLAKFEGKCWHEPHEIYLTNNHMVATTPVQECALCGCRYPEYPSYSTSLIDRERLWLYLMEKEEMWKAFDGWAWVQSGDLRTTEFIPWLFSPLDGVPRWVSLLSEWLGMEEVREKFGTTEVCSEFNRWHNPCPQFCDKCDDGSGKVRAEWAKEAK